MNKLLVTTSVNGDPEQFLCDAGTTLLDVLRDEMGLTGSKEGCGSGDCGAGTVQLEGRGVGASPAPRPPPEGRPTATAGGPATAQ